MSDPTVLAEMNEPKVAAGCPFAAGARQQAVAGARQNADWWPNQLNIGMLHQHSALSNPMGEAFDYAQAFKALDLDAVIKDLHALMTDSQDWWPRPSPRGAPPRSPR